jgi:ABC-type transport system involved in cytochrome c biogenesis permease component
MTKKQQRSAFMLAQAASAAAFIVLLIGLALSFQDSPASEKYVAAGLSGVGATLSAFLANTFYTAHRAANEQLNRYYLEPQRTGRILAAERLARFLNEAPGVVHAEPMIAALLSWEMPGESGNAKKKEPEPEAEEEVVQPA